jgi:IS4 transposase
LITYDNDDSKNIYRLISFAVGNETFLILTARQDLTTYQLITLYAYRWQIELLFLFLKRTMNGIHLVKHDSKGVTIQFYAMLSMALLQLRLKQHSIDIHHDAISSQTNIVSNQAIEDNDRQKFTGVPKWAIARFGIPLTVAKN